MRTMTGQPAYQRVADNLRRQIEEGALSPGAQLPTVTQLMAAHDVSSTVIKAAINQLKIEGLVVGQQGKGVFVREHPKSDGGGDSPEFTEIMGELKTMRGDLEQLNRRLARVEELVADEQPSKRSRRR
jgi:DNA-binding GntR family transcriptional regulator